MIDVMAELKDRRAKAEAKVARAAKALESAKKELEDLTAAERVMAEITGESPQPAIASGTASDRDTEIAKLLGTNEDDSSSPAELYPVYVEASGDRINLEAFRTALWRLQKKIIQGSEKRWAVKSKGGRYWRESVGSEGDDFDALIGGGGNH